MIKKIVFDLDDTLIDWDKNNLLSLITAAQDLNITYIGHQEMYSIEKSLLLFMETGIIFNQENLINYINQETGFNLPLEFVDRWLLALSNCAPDRVADEVYETLHYLSSKYELVVLTNWFSLSQTNRLEKAGLRKYFSKVYGVDNCYPKPSKEAFAMAIQDHQPHECLMIGNDELADIIPAFEIGMQAILYNAKQNPISKKGIQAITKFETLKEML